MPVSRLWVLLLLLSAACAQHRAEHATVPEQQDLRARILQDDTAAILQAGLDRRLDLTQELQLKARNGRNPVARVANLALAKLGHRDSLMGVLCNEARGFSDAPLEPSDLSYIGGWLGIRALATGSEVSTMIQIPVRLDKRGSRIQLGRMFEALGYREFANGNVEFFDSPQWPSWWSEHRSILESIEPRATDILITPRECRRIRLRQQERDNR